jgi:nucleotide-binding universal stress UspA family protein
MLGWRSVGGVEHSGRKHAMVVMVAVPGTVEGQHALVAAVDEAARLGLGLVVLNLTLTPIDESLLPDGMSVELIDASAGSPTDAVLRAIEARGDVDRLVVCLKRRSPVGKVFLGSLSQDLLLHAEVPILAVKLPAASAVDH